MKNVLLLTWYDNQNYGTALQAWALKSIIESPEITGLDFTCNEKANCSILPHIPQPTVQKSNKFLKLFSIKSYLMKLDQLCDKIERKRKKELFELREKAFKRFINDNLSFAGEHNIQSAEELGNIADKFDIFIAGSDQIWNPEALDEVYLLNWASPAKKLCSYASSLSVAQIPEEYEHIYSDALKRFYSISIRDTACRKQLTRLSQKQVKTVVDPVILIGQEAMSRLVRKDDSEEYIFCYFLGNNKAHRKTAIEYAKKHGLGIKAIINAGFSFRADKDLEPFAVWDAEPWEFVSLIANAKAVFTDSFHATVISSMLHRRFYTYEKDGQRPQQNNRITEYLTMIGLGERWNCAADDGKVITDDDWKRADDALLKSRIESMEYLMEVLN